MNHDLFLDKILPIFVVAFNIAQMVVFAWALYGYMS